MTPDWEDLLKEFVSVEWSACAGSITSAGSTYVYALVVEYEGLRFPLYVGQTRRLLGRVGDYHSAQFHAPTDFRVGEAIKYLRGEKQCRIDFLYQFSESHRRDEKVLIRELLLAGIRC